MGSMDTGHARLLDGGGEQWQRQALSEASVAGTVANAGISYCPGVLLACKKGRMTLSPSRFMTRKLHLMSLNTIALHK